MDLSNADANRPIAIGVGEELQISLDENPSTGFQWALEPVGGAIVSMLGSNSIAPSGSSIGAAGRRVWKFQARHPGDVQLMFKRWRQWEGEKSVTERLVYSIVVTG